MHDRPCPIGVRLRLRLYTYVTLHMLQRHNEKPFPKIIFKHGVVLDGQHHIWMIAGNDPGQKLIAQQVAIIMGQLWTDCFQMAGICDDILVYFLLR